jgi:hypothetical protein
MKTNELTGAALDWAVARCEGGTGTQINSPTWVSITMPAEDSSGTYEAHLHELAYSTDWAQGGPIIEREQLEVMPTTECGNGGEEQWEVRKFLSECELFAQYGPTPLIAAMRCYVASKLGDTVEVPTELG